MVKQRVVNHRTIRRVHAPILFSLAFLITVISYFYLYPASVTATTADKEPLTISLDSTSAKAMGALKRRFGQINDLLYLYEVKEKSAVVEIGFPGELIVAPDKTKLADLLSNTHSKIKINAEPNTLTHLFKADAPPAAKVLDSEKHLIGIITTQNAMEPFRTGAIVRSSENHSDTTDDTTAEAVRHPIIKDDSQPLEAKDSVITAHATPKDVSLKTADTNKTDHAVNPDTHAVKLDTEDKPQKGDTHTPSADNKSADQTEHGEKAEHPQKASEGPQAHGESDHPANDVEASHEKPDHKQLGHEPSFDASLPRGVALIEAITQPMNYELNERFWGWRPNDLIRVGDNVKNFQLGVLEITRRTAIILSERVSRTGESSRFDPQLENAMNWFMIKPDRYWFPSAESKYQDALDALTEYKDRLAKKQAKFFNRADNLIPLLMAYEDLLGSCEENLVKIKEEDGTPVSFFDADDYLYYTKGVTSTLRTILQAIEHDFSDVIASRQAQGDIHHAITSCLHAIEVDPILVMNNDASSIFANHRANQAAPLSHARFYLSVLIKTLST